MRIRLAALSATGAVAALALVVATAGCSEKITENKAALGGSCLGCHQGITDMHPYFALACVDCHGGNDAVKLPAVVDVRDQALLKASHVLPKDPTMWWPNGIDDNGDGRVDEPGEFFDGRQQQLQAEGLADKRVATKFEFDSEINRDMNYLRFINPGDLRVAEVSCGGHNRNANKAMVCHAETVYDVRRSIMALNSGVPAGALYGNAQTPKAADYGTAFLQSKAGQDFDARNPRIGRAAYAFDYDDIDANYDATANEFDRGALLKVASSNIDPNDNLFEATAGPVFADAEHGKIKLTDGTEYVVKAKDGFTRTGNKLNFFDDGNRTDNRAIDVIQNIGNSANRQFPAPGSALELRLAKIIEKATGQQRQTPIKNLLPPPAGPSPLSNPVDAALRTFRAYHVLNFMSPSDNFGFKDFFTSPNAGDAPPADPNDVELQNNNNPFGRMLSSGCTSCHVAYAKDGHNKEPIDRTVADNGRQPSTDLPFGIRTDLGQRAYAERHQLQTAVPLNQCAQCHGFVTRVDYAVEGKYELEVDFTNLSQVQTIGPFTYSTAKTACVNIFDNLAHFKDGKILNDGEGVTEDTNNNGELDPGEDTNNNGCLDLPDRVARSDSFDGRQSKFVYGGANGSTHLQDIHIELGMACSDCHVTSVHGDSNIYTRNWDSEPMECEDCHGTPTTRALLKSSGPNGGDDFTDPKWNTPFGKPWFEKKGDTIVEHSRTRADLQWQVAQLKDEKSGDNATGYAFYVHTQPFETGPDPGREKEARPLAHINESGKPGGLECYSCHSSWQPNCLTCHLKMDVGKPKQEIWWGDADTEDIFFQLFSYTRSPFILGRAGDVEGNRIATHRSTMQTHLTVTASNNGKPPGLTLLDNAMVASSEHLSSMVSNPYFPHTVRVTETKSCARCHTLEDDQGRIENDHMITEATGQGSGRYMNLGDWALVATNQGFQQIDIKNDQGNGSKNRFGDTFFNASSIPPGIQFPGFDVDDTNPRHADFLGLNATDVALLRGVAAVDGSSDIADIAIVAHSTGVSMIDVTGRDNVGLPPTEIARVDSLGPVVAVDVVDTAASQTKRFLAATDEEVCSIDFTDALQAQTVGPVIDPDAGRPGIDDGGIIDAGVDGTLHGTRIVGCLPHGKDAVTKVRIHGRFALLGHSRGVTLYQLDETDRQAAVDVGAPLAEIATFETTHPVLDIQSAGRFIYAATGQGGVEIFDMGPFIYPLHDQDSGQPLTGSTARVAQALTNLGVQADTRGLAVYGSRLLVADGKNGLRILQVDTPADPRLERTIRDVPGQAPIDQATDVVVGTETVRTYAVIADGAHGIRAVNITPSTDLRLQIKDSLDPAKHDQTRGFRLSQERWDPLTPYDVKNTFTKVFTFPTTGNAVALAKGLAFDNIADKSGRQLRDGWSIGSQVLDEATIGRMRSVIVKEVQGTVDIRGDGLGCVVRAGDEQNVTKDPGDPNRCIPVSSRGGG